MAIRRKKEGLRKPYYFGSWFLGILRDLYQE